VDVKFHVWTTDEPKQERVIALSHPELLRLSAATGHPLSDAWCCKIAALHLKHMLETGEDMEKTLVTVPPADLERWVQNVDGAVAKRG
jgi:hypothetical protein